jgi:hypothetical protein
MNDLTTATSPGTGSSKPAPERRVRHGLIEDWRDALGLLVLLLVATLFGALINRYWPGGDDDATRRSGDLVERMTSLEERLSAGRTSPEILALKARVAKLETKFGNADVATPPSGAPASLDPSKTALDELNARLTALESKTATTPEDIKAAGDEIAALDKRITHVENSDLLTLAHRAALATAVANLTRASQGSSPFKIEYDAVAALYPGDATLSQIAPIAARGIPTAGTLIATFGNAADDALDAERIANAKDWSAKLWANFASLISSRAIGEVTGNSTESRLARAQLRMKSGGDLRAAVVELSAIKGAARGPLTPWLTDAAARVKLEATLGSLNTRAAAALAGPVSTDDPSSPIPQLPTP